MLAGDISILAIDYIQTCIQVGTFIAKAVIMFATSRPMGLTAS